VFRSVGGEIRQSWCGPCFGQGPDALEKSARDHVVQSQPAEPHGSGRQGYLASPAVAASALTGYMAPPGELGLKWDPEKFGV
jgi:homoaconitase/3-isopropylmalate dehydratase large subunit